MGTIQLLFPEFVFTDCTNLPKSVEIPNLLFRNSQQKFEIIRKMLMNIGFTKAIYKNVAVFQCQHVNNDHSNEQTTKFNMRLLKLIA